MRNAYPSAQINTYRWLVLGLTTFSQMSIAFVGQGVGAIAPFLQTYFGLNHTEVGFAVSANNLGIGLTALFFGKFVDRFGEKKIMVLGGIMTGLSIFVAAASTSYWMLLFLLIETGLWAGSATPAGSKAIFNYFPASSRGTAMGIRQMGISAGAFLAALVLPLVTKAVTWNAALILAGIVAILANLLFLGAYREKKPANANAVPQREKTFDTALSGTAQPDANKLQAERLKTENAKTENAKTENAKTENAKTEKPKTRKPSLLKNKTLWSISVAGTTFIGTQFVVIGYSQLFLHRQAGMSYHYTFYFLAIAQLAGMIGRALWGTLSDLLFSSKRKPILFSIGIILAGLSLSMLTISPATPVWVLAVLFTLLGLAAMGWNGLWVTLVSELVHPSQSSSAVGTAISILQLGVLVFPIVFGFIVDRLGTYSVSWVFLACSVIVGLFLLARVKENTQEASVSE